MDSKLDIILKLLKHSPEIGDRNNDHPNPGTRDSIQKSLRRSSRRLNSFLETRKSRERLRSLSTCEHRADRSPIAGHSQKESKAFYGKLYHGVTELLPPNPMICITSVSDGSIFINEEDDMNRQIHECIEKDRNASVASIEQKRRSKSLDLRPLDSTLERFVDDMEPQKMSPMDNLRDSFSGPSNQLGIPSPHRPRADSRFRVTSLSTPFTEFGHIQGHQAPVDSFELESYNHSDSKPSNADANSDNVSNGELIVPSPPTPS